MRRNQFGFYDYSPPPLGPGTGGGVAPPPPVSSGSPPLTPPPALSSFGSTSPQGTPLPAPPATNYTQNILNDPLYQQEMAQLSSQGIQSAAERKAATDRALVNFGEIPDFTNAVKGLGLDPGSPMFQWLNSDVDEATRRGATGLTKSGLSTVARLRTGHNTALDGLMSTLAARGIVRSGSTGVGVGLENHNYLDGQFQARNQLLDYLSGVQSAFAQSEAMRAQQQAQYAQDATTRQSQQNPGTDTSGTWSPAINDYIPDSQWFGGGGVDYSGVNPWEGKY